MIVAYAESDLFETRQTDDGVEVTSTLKAEADRRLREFARELGRVEGVQAESTQHLAEALSFRYGRKRVLQMVEGILVGADHQTVAIVLRLTPAKGPEATTRRAVTFAEIRQRAKAHSPPAVVVGEPVQVHDMFRYVEEDGRTLFWWSLGLLAVVILVLFRRIRWVLLPLLVVVSAIVWTEAILVVSGMQLSMVSSLLNSLLTIVGVATVTRGGARVGVVGEGEQPAASVFRGDPSSMGDELKTALRSGKKITRAKLNILRPEGDCTFQLDADDWSVRGLRFGSNPDLEGGDEALLLDRMARLEGVEEVLEALV